jgi:MFS transporter, OPA family, solute carrier family 37 (glycerol-3-phosphate transporter), member 1/2
MVGAGLFTAAFGAGYWFSVHSFYYSLGVQMVAGRPVSVVRMAVSGCGRRQLVREEQEGNISGSLIAAAMLKDCWWCWSFGVPGIMIALDGLTVYYTSFNPNYKIF